jgi:putative chitinase
MITKEVLKEIAPRSNDKIISDLEKYFDVHMANFGVDTYLRVCHFIAQCAHESDSFKTLEEYASGAAYEGRRDLGNTQPGDGRRFKGRGIIQLTGRFNYRDAGKRLGYDLENNPLLALQPEISVLTALDYWKTRNLNQWADRDDVATVTRRINGGLNGFSDRKMYLERAKRVLRNVNFSAPKATTKTAEPKKVEPKVETKVENIILAKRGEKSDYIKDLQNLLISKGAKIVADGDFGARTEQAVRDFQMWSGLQATGMIDTVTLDRLMKK